jgi:hypothetical protein
MSSDLKTKSRPTMQSESHDIINKLYSFPIKKSQVEIWNKTKIKICKPSSKQIELDDFDFCVIR